MLTEKKLLLDIIQNAPENSVWNISSDSWEQIPQVFSQYLCINKVYGWDITINQENRKHLMKVIEKEEIYDKIVHQDISLNGLIIFQSYDHMVISILDSSFPNYMLLIEKYKYSEDFCLE